MSFKRKPSKNSSFSHRSPFQPQTLLTIPLIFIAWACYEETHTHEREGEPVTPLNIQGSSWQQPRPACSGAMKYLWFWSCPSLGFGSLSCLFFYGCLPKIGVWGGGRLFLSPAATAPTPSCLSVLLHSCPHTQTGAQHTSARHGKWRGRALQAKPLTPTPILIIKRLEHCVTVC